MVRSASSRVDDEIVVVHMGVSFRWFVLERVLKLISFAQGAQVLQSLLPGRCSST